MYLKRIRARNFRVFGDGTTAPELNWELNPGLNILVGENDAGKTGIVDAIRQVLLTTSYESVRLYEQDFHIHGSTRAESLFIEATLSGLTKEQEGAVLEWLTLENDDTCSLIVHIHAKFFPAQSTKRARVDVIVRAGKDGTGPEIGYAVRELVRATYLRPLRDAEAELRPGRQSRLSQILAAHNDIAGQEVNDFSQSAPGTVPENLVGLMAFAQHHLGEHKVIKGVQEDINKNYLGEFSFTGDQLESRIRIAPDLSLTPILEKFELSLLPSGSVHPDERCVRGLGYNNALFMATELVLLRDGDELALLLVEEPEAHLHPQLQDRVMELLKQHSKEPADGKRRVQVVMTTHSPSLVSSADIETMTMVHKGQTYPLSSGHTKLKKTDYSFLQRFIDATKANLFFARGVMMVEGPAEAILLPTLADACGRSFSKHGVSIVNVGHTGLYHYARILQRQNPSPEYPVPVVCLTDRDIVPDIANTYVQKPKTGKRFEADYDEKGIADLVQSKKNRAQGGKTIVCVSDRWTLEYDLALGGCAEVMHIAIALAEKAKTKDEALSDRDEELAKAEAETSWKALQSAKHTPEKLASVIYQPLYEKKASKAIAAQYAAQLFASGNYGKSDTLFKMLPPYLQAALAHLTTPPAAPVSVTGSPVSSPLGASSASAVPAGTEADARASV
ncbi:AAA family ATPase [Burkholderia pseudomallei]|uniref:ATP-dependent nuclease n=1 Tax=Burkholderia pseudomallei TaxID=28450 RepID=UPI002933A831|nr:AAA family ATPase [Burkholderia pseudomallei]MDV2119470.1 AAA family ATPase [Burkholderia pseudomallei]MDV2155164.1 AAA family ATPase [Burkholderia pseudomallei]